MRTRLVGLLLLISSFVLAGLGSKTIAQNNQSTVASQATQTKSVLTVDVEDVLLDTEIVRASCIYETSSNVRSLSNAGIKVWTVTKETEQVKPTYYYTVSGGQIVGQGKNVFWDFKGAKEGKHTITVGVGKDYIVRGKSITKTIDLRCYDMTISEAGMCQCPAIDVFGPTNSANSGDSMVFAVNVFGLQKEKIKFEWSVSGGGVILAGQGTSQIMVKTGLDVDSVTATIQIGGTDPSCNCMTKVSKTVSLAGEKP